MKSHIIAAGAFACITSLGFAEIGKVTINLTRTVQNYFVGEELDEDENPVQVAYKASITEAAHNQAIADGKNSTRTLTYSTKKEKVTNRQILEAMKEAELLTTISNWAIGEEDGVLVAYKKGEISVNVPEGLFDIGSTSAGVGTGKHVEKFVASKNRLTGSGKTDFTSLAQDFSLQGVSLNGSVTGRVDQTEIAENFDPAPGSTNTFEIVSKYRMTFSLVGASSTEFISGKVSASGSVTDTYTDAPEVEEVE